MGGNGKRGVCTGTCTGTGTWSHHWNAVLVHSVLVHSVLVHNVRAMRAALVVERCAVVSTCMLGWAALERSAVVISPPVGAPVSLPFVVRYG